MGVVHIAIRAKSYGEYVIEFLKSSPDGVVVNIGYGLDSRFSRIDNGRVRFHEPWSARCDQDQEEIL